MTDIICGCDGYFDEGCPACTPEKTKTQDAPAMTDTQGGGWPDDAREALEWALAVHFTQNRQPCMSGDPRDRLSSQQRRNMEDARDAALEALAPILKAREAAAAMAMRDAAANSSDCGCDVRAIVLERLASHGLREAERCCGQHYDACCALTAQAIRALPLPGTGALDALLAQARSEAHELAMAWVDQCTRAYLLDRPPAVEAFIEAIRQRGSL